MKFRTTHIVAVGLTAALLSTAGLAYRSGRLFGDDETPIDVTKLPAAVQATAKTVFGKLDGLKATQEKNGNTLIFEVEGKGKDGMDVSFTCPENGMVYELEHAVAASALPADATKNLQAKFPGATMVSATAVEMHYFEVKMQKDGKTSHAVVGVSGRVQDDEEDEEGEESEEGGR